MGDWLTSNGEYVTTVLTTMAIFAIAAIGLHVTLRSGQFSVTHATLMGVGGYIGGYTAKELGLPYPAAWLVALVLTGLVGGLISFVVSRLGGLFLAIATLALAEGLATIARMVFPGGEVGYTGVPLATGLANALVVLIMVLAGLHLTRSTKPALDALAMGADEVAAASIGISRMRVRLIGFALGGALAGLAGAMNVQHVGLIEPADLGFANELSLLIMVILGGRSSPWGALMGATVIIASEEFLRVATLDRYWIIGVILIVMVSFRQQGVIQRHPLKGPANIPRET